MDQYSKREKNIYKFILQKAYFDKGWGLTSYLKYVAVVIGIRTTHPTTAIYLGIAYGILCYIVGRLWYHYRLTDAEMEVQNHFNPFVQEMRKNYG